MLKVGVIGLGKMGKPIALKLNKSHCQLTVYDISELARQEFKDLGISVAASISDLSAVSEIIWVMVDNSQVDNVLSQLCACTEPGTIIIDGGNSYFKDTIRRANELAQKGFDLLDCGSSGGLWGADRGFSLTIGGDHRAFEKAKEVFEILAVSPQAYVYVGPSGSGHYVKMVHNGIEYALLQSYADGFSILHNGHYNNLDLAAISNSWMHGAIIRSWILQLFHDVLLQDQDLESVDGAIGENGTGRWAALEAQEYNIPVKLIDQALKVRQDSRVTGGNYSTKLVGLVRHKMGGHPLGQLTCDICKKVQVKL